MGKRRLPVTVVFGELLEARLRAHCEAIGLTPSEYVRAAVLAKLDKEDGKSRTVKFSYAEVQE